MQSPDYRRQLLERQRPPLVAQAVHLPWVYRGRRVVELHVILRFKIAVKFVQFHCLPSEGRLLSQPQLPFLVENRWTLGVLQLLLDVFEAMQLRLVELRFHDGERVHGWASRVVSSRLRAE